jgi:uncharacterized protein (DUF2164 family)
MSAYHENQGIREAIDRILKRNAKRQANQGLETTDEQKERDAREWSNDLMQIAKLDKEFADSLHVETD